MSVSGEMQEFGRDLAKQFSASAELDRKTLVADITTVIDAKLTRIENKITKLERVVAEVVTEQRQQKKILTDHGERLARGDAEFKRQSEEIKRQYDLIMIALKQTSCADSPAAPPVNHNSVLVTNSPGIRQDQPQSVLSNLRGPAAGVAAAGGAWALWKLLTMHGG